MKRCLVKAPVGGLLCTAICVALGIVCFAAAPAMAGGHYEDGIWIPDGVCVDCGNDAPPSNPPRYRQRDDSAEQARIERNARYDAVHTQAYAAWERGDYREALRLLREQQILRDGPHVRADIANLEKYLADQANTALADSLNQQANSAKESGDDKLALKLYKQALATYPNTTSEYRQYIADFEKYVEREERSRNERLKREAEAAERERLHRPEVEQLRAEAKAMLDKSPADALAKLDAALKFIPGDAKTTGDWWLAQASLALQEARYDAAFEALQKAQGYSPEATELALWNSRVKEAREQQGANVQSAFGDLRRRLATPAGSADPGAQLKSIEQGSRGALSSSVAEKNFLTPGRADKEQSGEGFDTPGENRGKLAYPDKSKHRQLSPSALDRQIPAGAKDDPQVRQMQDWYRSLEAQKAEKEQKIAELRAQQKTSSDPVLATKITTLTNDVKRLADDQGNAMKTVEERVAVIKKQTLDKGLVWDESPAQAAATPAESDKGQAPGSAKLDFIQD